MTAAEKTAALYDTLPQEEELRKKRTDVRDQAYEINKGLFVFIANRTPLDNCLYSKEDKVQTVTEGFLEWWWWWRWTGSKRRTDLAFTTFFTPRLGEYMERKLNQIPYSYKRTLLMKASKSVGIHWGKLRYEHIPKISGLTPDEIDSVGAILWNQWNLSIEDPALNIPSMEPMTDAEKYLDSRFDSYPDLLLHEMVILEKKLTDQDLTDIASLYFIDISDLRRALPEAERKLYRKLKEGL